MVANGRHSTFCFNQLQRGRLIVSLSSQCITIEEGPDTCPELPRIGSLIGREAVPYWDAQAVPVPRDACQGRGDSAQGTARAKDF